MTLIFDVRIGVGEWMHEIDHGYPGVPAVDTRGGTLKWFLLSTKNVLRYQPNITCVDCSIHILSGYSL